MDCVVWISWNIHRKAGDKRWKKIKNTAMLWSNEPITIVWFNVGLVLHIQIYVCLSYTLLHCPFKHRVIWLQHVWGHVFFQICSIAYRYLRQELTESHFYFKESFNVCFVSGRMTILHPLKGIFFFFYLTDVTSNDISLRDDKRERRKTNFLESQIW